MLLLLLRRVKIALTDCDVFLRIYRSRKLSAEPNGGHGQRAQPAYQHGDGNDNFAGIAEKGRNACGKAGSCKSADNLKENLLKSKARLQNTDKKVLTKITPEARKKTRNALETASSGIFLLKAVQCLFETTLCIFRTRTKQVVVLIPPPVEPGEAPMNIRAMMKKSPAVVIPSIGSVANPAVRAKTD